VGNSGKGWKGVVVKDLPTKRTSPKLCWSMALTQRIC